MLQMFSRHTPQRLVQRCLVAWLLGTVLWSSSVAIAAAAMGCCDQPQACCTVGVAPSCATCVPPLSAPSAQLGALPTTTTAAAVSPYPVHATPVACADIWRPPKALAA
jgi:hypothetical protein